MINMKKIMKFAGAACTATGIVALSGLVASGAAVGAVIEGFKSAANTVKKMLTDDPQAESGPSKAEESAVEVPDVEPDVEPDTGNQELSAD